jgi:uncharacterized OB-fold protein
MISPVKVWRNQKRIQSLLGKQGKILAWTIIYVPPGRFSFFAPYPIAIVELDNGQKITAQLVDCDHDEVKTNARVETVLRKVTEPSTDGVIPYGIKVKLV